MTLNEDSVQQNEPSKQDDNWGNLKFETLLQKLEGVLSDIENDESGIDELSDSVNVAYDMVSALKLKLTDTEASLLKVISMRDAELGEGSAIE